MGASKLGEVVFQPMPPLTGDQLVALREDIAEHGVLVPVTVDQHGRIIDGHNRSMIADELGITYPTITVQVADDDAAMDLAVTLNGARRHLNQEQKRALIEHELIRRPGDSDRAISRRVGCSPTTVGTVRAERRALFEQSAERASDAIAACYANLFAACRDLMLLGADPQALIERARLGRDDAEATLAAAGSDDWAAGVAVITRNLYTTLVNDLTSVVAEVEAEGVEFPLPQQLPKENLDALVDQIHPLLSKGVQIGQSGAESRVGVQ